MGRTPEEESADRVKADEARSLQQTDSDQKASNARTQADDRQVAGEIAVDDARQIVRDAEQRGLRTVGPAPDVRQGITRRGAAAGMATVAGGLMAAVRAATGREAVAPPPEAPAARGTSRREEARQDNVPGRAPVIKLGFA